MEQKQQRNLRKERLGKVVSIKCDKTAIVKVSRKFRHPIYGKFLEKTKKFIIHDEKNECKKNDLVKIMETRPLSKTKRWRLLEIIEKSK